MATAKMTTSRTPACARQWPRKLRALCWFGLFTVVLHPAVALARDPYSFRELLAISLDRQHSYTGGRYENHVFRYRLFKPRPFDPQRSYPLILWLHGYGYEPDTD